VACFPPLIRAADPPFHYRFPPPSGILIHSDCGHPARLDPIVADADIEGLRKVYSDREVAEIVFHTCNAAFFDRITEAANLPLD
jgi:hypothetical protein